MPYGYFYVDPVGHGRIFAVPAGGGAPVVLASGDDAETIGMALAFDDANVYFVDERTSADADAGTSRSLVALAAYTGARQTLAGGLDDVTLMAVDGDDVTFASWKVNPDGEGGYIARVAKAGGPLRYVADLVDDQQPQGLTVDAGYVYWTQRDGTVRRVSIDGGTPEDIMPGELNPREIAVSGTSVYWLLAGTPGVDCVATDGAVRRVTPGTFQVTTLAQGLAGVRSLVSGGGAIYWSMTGSFCNVGGQGKGAVFSLRPTRRRAARAPERAHGAVEPVSGRRHALFHERRRPALVHARSRRGHPLIVRS